MKQNIIIAANITASMLTIEASLHPAQKANYEI